MEIVSVKNLSFRYPDSDKDVLKDLNFSLSCGEFVTLCGLSGCGKSTLLRQLKTVLAPNGIKKGEILFNGKNLEDIDRRIQSEEIGFVGQSPENQIVTDKVWHELAFGLENLGLDTSSIRSRTAETASFFGIQNWFEKNTSELSGGQKQLLNLASVMIMQPKILILDEPASQLDPIAAGEFLSAVVKINRELGITVFMTEHRLEDIIPYSDRIFVMEEGHLTIDDTPYNGALTLKNRNNKMFYAMPSPMRIWANVPNSGEKCPLTVSEGRVWLENYARINTVSQIQKKDETIHKTRPSLELNEVFFRYEKNAPDVLKGVSLKAYPGELLAVMGGNGTGKSTMLSLITGANRPYRGDICINGQKAEKIDNLFDNLLGVLPQNPQAVFTEKTVFEDLCEMKKGNVEEVLKLCELEDKKSAHPYDLSGGEQQRAALAKVLLTNPKILLLDEPTKGMDALFKRRFACILKSLLERGVTIVMVSHDIEFCASYADRCALFFNGAVAAENTPVEFFRNNSFYTTSASRMAKTVIPYAITSEEVISACGGNNYEEDYDIEIKNFYKDAPINDFPKKKEKINFWKKITLISGVLFFCLAILSKTGILPEILRSDWIAYGFICVSLILFAVSFRQKGYNSSVKKEIVKHKKLSKRTIAAVLIIIAAIPLTVFLGVFYLGEDKYLFTSFAVLIEAMIPFFLVFEGRKPQARELVIIAVLCALGVAGRSVFYMFPHFKPVAALTIVAGIAFGGETGFLVGALTMLSSNIFFQQGPWTLWQMIAMGTIGFVSGIIYNKLCFSKNKIILSVFGFFSAFIIYGAVMNFAAVIMSHAKINFPTVLSYIISGMPVDIIHAFATGLFLFFLAEPMLQKLERVKLKYGLMI